MLIIEAVNYFETKNEPRLIQCLYTVFGIGECKLRNTVSYCSNGGRPHRSKLVTHMFKQTRIVYAGSRLYRFAFDFPKLRQA